MGREGEFDDYVEALAHCCSIGCFYIEGYIKKYLY